MPHMLFVVEISCLSHENCPAPQWIPSVENNFMTTRIIIKRRPLPTVDRLLPASCRPVEAAESFPPRQWRCPCQLVVDVASVLAPRRRVRIYPPVVPPTTPTTSSPAFVPSPRRHFSGVDILFLFCHSPTELLSTPPATPIETATTSLPRHQRALRFQT